MTKKIGDITIAEIRRICEVQSLCKECPLYKKDEELEEVEICVVHLPDFILDLMLDVEVEVPEETDNEKEN